MSRAMRMMLFIGGPVQDSYSIEGHNDFRVRLSKGEGFQCLAGDGRSPDSGLAVSYPPQMSCSPPLPAGLRVADRLWSAVLGILLLASVGEAQGLPARLGSGPAGGTYGRLAENIAGQYPNLGIEVVETAGSGENLKLL